MPGERERIVRAYNEACSHDDVAAITAFFADGAVIYDLNHPPVRGRDAIGAFWRAVRVRWRGAVWTTDLVVDDERAVAAEWTMRGTAPDGQAFAFRGADVFGFAAVDGALRIDRDRLDSGLVDYPYDGAGPLGVDRP